LEVRQAEPLPVGVLMIALPPVIREGLQSILKKDEKITVVGHVLSENQAIEQIIWANKMGQPVKVVLTESRSGNVNGVQAIRAVKQVFPGICALVLTENLNDSYVIDTIDAGADGFIFLKDMSPEILLQTIHRVVEGGKQMNAELRRSAVETLIQNGRKTLAERTAGAASLTDREVDVLRLMGNGDTNKLIAEKLGITMDTTKNHVRKVIVKLNARSRAKAAIIAAQMGLVGKPVTVSQV
jgi:DNA-binding NarL/FixJ family response regulator